MRFNLLQPNQLVRDRLSARYSFTVLIFTILLAAHEVGCNEPNTNSEDFMSKKRIVG